MRKVTLFLCCVWALSLLYGEMFAFWVAPLWSCSWPQLPQSFSSKIMSEVSFQDNHVKIAVLADPQLMDRTSLGLPPKSLALEIAQFYTDLYMRRSFLASILPLKPNLILFLGDYFDGGHLLSDEEWQESLSRFKHIFNLNRHRRNLNVPAYYISGNHDIGYTGFHSHHPEVINRYEKEFGERNYRFTAGKVDFISVDAQTLDGAPQGKLTSTSWNFIRNISMDIRPYPKVLLTHIPLYRSDWTPCGIHRSSPIINQRVSRAANGQEIMYQNYLSKETSTLLLDFIRPALVLSGHDHDQCMVNHLGKYGTITEHTVGTLSWQQGNLYPSFMLLSASMVFSNTTNPEDALSTQLCFLPMQTHIYIWYLSIFFVTLIAVLFWPTNDLDLWHHCNHLMGSIRRALTLNLLKSRAKEKNEDESCDYEMIWDAEGSMHLVKKVLKIQPGSSNDSGIVGRGNAVVRSTAKKQISHETDASCSVDLNSDIRLDAICKLPPRLNKPRTKVVTVRLFQAFQMLMVIAAVNIPLYMMLLFKDWIDL
ncbi:PREDICTED: uncharacterized protein C630.12 [Nelumbo nucifera]|uniref:Uncharacterized protein C630.12 n=2 Tax=Nelumbo nucifera TaxID=4432 RepID=A0A1U8BM50_NELNU|nr:PREDICTED: uncharacterized protein C630.12 [Nelumbo nucifera]DAD46364.1 TPA_asm: hypothetical protein HUJ06_004594 [Nelumbo nucifera]